MAKVTSYKYTPLAPGEIRLLQIYRQGEELIYSLDHYDFTLAPPYSTLSYTWDDQPRDQILSVGGSVLKVIQNINTVLPYLTTRSPLSIWNVFAENQPQHFWIDGLCINQDDDDEKDVQVPLMHKIYTRARKGVIWLGEGNTAIDAAVEAIPLLVQKFSSYDSRLGFDDYSFGAHGIPRLSSPVWSGINHLLSRGWFSRVWTFQEAVLPQVIEFRCGRQMISFDGLANLASLMMRASLSGTIEHLTDSQNTTKQTVQASMNRLYMIDAERRSRKRPSMDQFPLLLSEAWEWSCSNPLDHIYGLLGMAHPLLQQEITIDYNKSPAEVYFDFSRIWIMQSKKLHLLHLVSPESRLPGLPSWVPNFSHLSVASPFFRSASTAGYCAGYRRRNSHLDIVPEFKTLHVQGFQVDEISEVLPCPWERNVNLTPQSKNASIALSLSWERHCLALSQKAHKSGTEFPEAHWRTLIANKYAYGSPFTGDGLESYHLLRIMLTALAPETSNTLTPEEQRLAATPMSSEQLLAVQAFAEAFGYAGHARSFFSTQGGRIGLGPTDAKYGDAVCILYSVCTPFVLRQLYDDARGSRIEVIGECYVDGCMYGECVDMPNKNRDEIFKLV